MTASKRFDAYMEWLVAALGEICGKVGDGI